MTVVYGMAIVLEVGQACALLICRTPPRLRRELGQEVREASLRCS